MVNQWQRTAASVLVSAALSAVVGAGCGQAQAQQVPIEQPSPPVYLQAAPVMPPDAIFAEYFSEIPESSVPEMMLRVMRVYIQAEDHLANGQPDQALTLLD